MNSCGNKKNNPRGAGKSAGKRLRKSLYLVLLLALVLCLWQGTVSANVSAVPDDEQEENGVTVPAEEEENPPVLVQEDEEEEVEEELPPQLPVLQEPEIIPALVEIPAPLPLPAGDYVPASLTDESAGSLLKFRIEYEAPAIAAGDLIVIKLSPSTSAKIKISGLADNTAIYNDDGIEVGTRNFSYEADGVCVLTVTFNNTYEGRENVKGWYFASAEIEYLENVTEDEVTVEVEINGDTDITVEIPPGNPGEDEKFDPGKTFAKHWRYGNKSGSEQFQDLTTDGDYTKLEQMRWYLPIGFLNLTNRDMRASEGLEHWTTEDSLKYSNDNPAPSPPWDRYTTANENYLIYGDIKNVDEPFHYNDVFLDDYLDVGVNYSLLYSPHEYIEDSLRIVRVIGRDEGPKDIYKYVADSNFLVASSANIDQIYRYTGPPPQSPFPGYRGLTIEEFFAQLKAEGQYASYSSWQDILTFDWVNNGAAPPLLIPHFRLELGDLHFSDSYSGTVTGRRTNAGYTVVNWALGAVAAKNLPYAYLVYYDTKATGIELDDDFLFRYYNRARLSYGDVVINTDYIPIAIRYEASGGSGIKPASLKIMKVDEEGTGVADIVFTLSGPGGYQQERTTSGNGAASFIIRAAGEYTLSETVPPGSNLLPIAPLTFTVTAAMLGTGGTGIIDLTDLLPANYSNGDDISFEDITGNNIIVNYPQPVDVSLQGQKTLTGQQQNSDITAGQFTFTLTAHPDNPSGCTWSGSNPLSAAAGTGAIDFGSFNFTKSGVYVFTIEENAPNPVPKGWSYDTQAVTVTYTVVSNNHLLEVDSVTYSKNGQSANGVGFTNTYIKPLYDAALRKWVSAVNGSSAAADVQDSINTAAAGTPSAAVKVKKGDKVTFDIELFNQCLETVILNPISDYLAPGYDFDPADNPGWVNSGLYWDSTAKAWTTTVIPGALRLLQYTEDIELTPGASEVIKLTLTVRNDATDATLANTAEISGMTDEDGEEVDDEDSIPDDNPEDDVLKDNEIDEDGKNIDGDDEDDHDIAVVELEEEPIQPIYDAALRKWVSAVNGSSAAADVQDSINTAAGGTPSAAVKVKKGDKVTFDIELFNQCQETVILNPISDYLAPGYDFDPADNPGWIDSGLYWDSTAKAWTATVIPGALRLLQYTEDIELTPGASEVIKLTLTVRNDATNATLANTAEISGMTDEDGEEVDDEDSTPNDNPEDDVLKDNEIDEDGQDGNDEDDHDIAVVELEEETEEPNLPIYDAALRKWVYAVERNGAVVTGPLADPGNTPSPPQLVKKGDKVVFAIKLFNQGTENVILNPISDYLPAGYDFDATDARNSGWVNRDLYWNSLTKTWTATVIPGALRLMQYTVDIPLAPGENHTIYIVLTVRQDATNANLTNAAEISGMTDEDGDEVDDEDSTPDDNPEDDELKDNEIDEDGQDGNDEDDHDIAEVELLPDTAAVHLYGTKRLQHSNGSDLSQAAGQFTFTLTPGANNPSGFSWSGSFPITSAANGVIDFGVLTFTQAGVYTFILAETPGNASGYTYDTGAVTVTVTVTEVQGELTAAISSYSKDGVRAESISFRNTYTPPTTPPDRDRDRPPTPRTPGNNLIPEPDDNSYIEVNGDNVPLGRWDWDEDNDQWIFEDLTPLGGLPQTGTKDLLYPFLLFGFSVIGMSITLQLRRKKHLKQASK